MLETKVTIINKAGLHARAAAKLANVCSGFASDIQIGHEKRLTAKYSVADDVGRGEGHHTDVQADGPDQQKPKAVADLVNERFGETA